MECHAWRTPPPQVCGSSEIRRTSEIVVMSGLSILHNFNFSHRMDSQGIGSRQIICICTICTKPYISIPFVVVVVSYAGAELFPIVEMISYLIPLISHIGTIFFWLDNKEPEHEPQLVIVPMVHDRGLRTCAASWLTRPSLLYQNLHEKDSWTPWKASVGVPSKGLG